MFSLADDTGHLFYDTYQEPVGVLILLGAFVLGLLTIYLLGRWF